MSKVDIILTNNGYEVVNIAKILTGEWLEPQLIYGYFPCTAEGNSVHVYDPSVIEQGLTPQTATPVVTWTFPRQKSLRRLCLADFFRPLSENKFDVFPMQAVTMGEVVLFKADNYANYLYFRHLHYPPARFSEKNSNPS